MFKSVLFFKDRFGGGKITAKENACKPGTEIQRGSAAVFESQLALFHSPSPSLSLSFVFFSHSLGSPARTRCERAIKHGNRANVNTVKS